MDPVAAQLPWQTALILGIPGIMAALGTLLTLVFALKDRKLRTAQAVTQTAQSNVQIAQLNEVALKTDLVHTATNSMKDQLVAATKVIAKAVGVEEGRALQKSEQPALQIDLPAQMTVEQAKQIVLADAIRQKNDPVLNPPPPPAPKPEPTEYERGVAAGLAQAAQAGVAHF